MSSDGPEASTEDGTGSTTGDLSGTTAGPNPRVVLLRKLEFLAIAIGGVFIIVGWGIGHHEWARALGWLFAGVGFAIEMIYGRVFRASRATAAQAERPPGDESGS